MACRGRAVPAVLDLRAADGALGDVQLPHDRAPSEAPFGADVEYRSLFPAEPLALEKNRISDLDVLPLIDGTSISIVLTANPGVHDDADVEHVLGALERILSGWAHGWDADRRLSG